MEDVIDFYNFATGTLLDELSTLIKSSNGSSTWRPLITYKNILRAIENIGTEMSLGLRLSIHFFEKTTFSFFFLCALSFTIFLLTLPKVHWTWQALGQELREPDRAAQAVEGVHDASGNFCLQLEGELGQSPANKSFQSLQLDLPVP